MGTLIKELFLLIRDVIRERKARGSTMHNDRKTRLIVAVALNILLFIIFLLGGMTIAWGIGLTIFAWLCYSGVQGGLMLYKHSTHYSAEVHAQEAARLAAEGDRPTNPNG